MTVTADAPAPRVPVSPDGPGRGRLIGTVAAVVILVTVAGLGLLYGCERSGVELDARGFVVGDRPAAPAITGELIEGGNFDVGRHRGEVVVVNFWGSWCPPCRAELPELVAAYEATKADRVTFIGINTRDQRDNAVQFITAAKPTFSSLFDPSGEVALEFDVSPSTIPATIVLDRSGRIAVVLRKAVYREDLEAVIRTVATEPNGD